MIEYIYDRQIESKDYKLLYSSISNAFKNLNKEYNNKISGVYIIYNKNQDVVYVGQSKNIASRITTHMRGKYKKSYKIDVFPLDYVDDEQITSFERFLITKLKPIDNVMVEQTYNPIDVESILLHEDIETLEDKEIIELLIPCFCVFPNNKFIVKGDFLSSLYILTNAIKETEYEQN